MAGVPRGGPRSVPDPDGERYDEMIRQERLKTERAEAVGTKSTNSIGHPGFAESLIPVWGSGREAVADWQEGDYAGAALNGALAASDLFLAGSVARGMAKGGFYVARNVAKEAPYAWKSEVRPWMGKQKFLKPKQHGHHWAIPQNGWGKDVPDFIKNQPWNIIGFSTRRTSPPVRLGT